MFVQSNKLHAPTVYISKPAVKSAAAVAAGSLLDGLDLEGTVPEDALKTAVNGSPLSNVVWRENIWARGNVCIGTSE